MQTDCDRLAGSPFDQQRNGAYAPVNIAEIDGGAVDACRVAFEATGNPRFAYQLGRALNKVNEPDQAMGAYNAAVKDGYPAAMVNFGMLMGRLGDESQEFNLYQQAANGGNVLAAYNLGVAYRDGLGTQQDVGKALEWFEKAAAEGDDTAAFNIGAIYDEGQLVAADDQTAVAWYDLAAQRGNTDAMINLGLMYEAGEGVPANAQKAAEMYAEAAKKGDVFGAYKFMQFQELGVVPAPSQDGTFEGVSYTGNGRNFGVSDHKLAVDEILQDHPGLNELRGICLFDLQPELGHVHETVENTAIADIDDDPPPVGRLQTYVELVNEGWHHGQSHPFATAIPTCCPGAHQACRGFQRDDGFRFVHLDDPGFKQRRRYADRIRTRACMSLVRLKDDEGGIGVRVLRRQQEIDRTYRRTAWLKAKKAPEFLPLGIRVQPGELCRYAVTGDLWDTADCDPADFPFRMNIQQLDRALPSHRSDPKWRDRWAAHRPARLIASDWIAQPADPAYGLRAADHSPPAGRA
eukprot:g25306.t1